MTSALEPTESEFARLCEIAGLQAKFFTSPQHDGSAHVEFDGTEYKYIVTERGREFERRVTTDRDELLY